MEEETWIADDFPKVKSQVERKALAIILKSYNVKKDLHTALWFRETKSIKEIMHILSARADK